MPYPNYTPKEISAFREQDEIGTLLMSDDDCVYYLCQEEEARLAKASGSPSNHPARKKTMTKKTVTGDIPDLGDWPRFYQEVLGMTPDFSGLVIPNDPGGYGWILPVAKGLTANRVWAEYKEKRIPCTTYIGDDLDKAVPTHERTAEKASYIIRVRDRVEADEELANLSAKQIKKQNLKTMTLTERLLLELWYLWKTGKHLDINNITLCAGSRDSGGSVPLVYWRDGELYVSWYYPVDARGFLRARSAVS